MLFWRYVHRKTLAIANEINPMRIKDMKERLAVLACANAAGTLTLKLLMIGKLEWDQLSVTWWKEKVKRTTKFEWCIINGWLLLAMQVLWQILKHSISKIFWSHHTYLFLIFIYTQQKVLVKHT